MGTGMIVKNSQFIKDVYLDVFKAKASEEVDSQRGFEEIIRSAGITDEALAERIQQGNKMLWLGLIFITFLLLYALYLLITAQFFSGFVTLLLSMLMCSYSWREHFILTKLKYRKTHLTVRGWFHLLTKRN